MQERILIIDDDLDTLRLVGLMLQREGYEISAAASGAEGLSKAESEHPDVILLDVMMPDLDGFEVARRLKRNPLTQATPILMFTAKSQLEDKVAAFEVGADDYLTKPTSPADLQSHVRQLIEHAHEKQAVATPVQAMQAGHGIAVLAPRAGLGVSTLALNLAAALCARGHTGVVLAELTPGQGTVGMDLGMPNQRALSELLGSEPARITPDRVAPALAHHSCGVQLLVSSENPRDTALLSRSEQFEALFRALISLASFLVMDMGAGLQPWAAAVLTACKDRLVVTDASPNTIAHTRILLDEIAALGIAPETVKVVLNNRARFDAQFQLAEAQGALGHPINATISPAPELMMASARRHLPAVVAIPEDVTSQQILKIADSILVPGKAA